MRISYLVGTLISEFKFCRFNVNWSCADSACSVSLAETIIFTKWIYASNSERQWALLFKYRIVIDNGSLCLCTIWIWKVMGLCNEACRIHVQFLIFVFTVSSFWIFPFSHDQTTLSQHHIMMNLSVVLINSFNDTQEWMTPIIFR